ncbi:hypothetical protein [Streptomyces sp. NPDC097610]|uniref:hypothetical protein n=1 Tax=Streptomyces sp. NPDC097610 TaxID=3157227 RepID=UPI00332D67A4
MSTRPCPSLRPPGRAGSLHCQTLVDPARSQRLVVCTATPVTESDTDVCLLSLLAGDLTQKAAVPGRQR